MNKVFKQFCSTFHIFYAHMRIKPVDYRFMVVLVPCFLICTPLVFGYERSENFDRSSQYGRSSFEELVGVGNVMSRPVILGDIDKRERRGESRSEFGPGLPSRALYGQVESKPISNPTSQEDSYHRESSTNKCYFIGSKLQFWASAISGCLIASLLAPLYLKPFIRFLDWWYNSLLASFSI